MSTSIKKESVMKRVVSLFSHSLMRIFDRVMVSVSMGRLLFIVCLFILFIFLRKKAGNDALKIRELKNEVNDLKAEHGAIKSEIYNFQLQSSISEKVKPLGLRDIDKPPLKLKVK